MLELDSYLTINKETIDSPNLCDRFSDDDLLSIGDWCNECLKRDRASRADWYRRNRAAMDLAMQVQVDKSFPWTGCSNVKFPLVTIAALQFHSRAYPAIVDGDQVVKARVIGEDPEGVLTARADRVSTHMSWQCTEQDEEWEDNEDRALLNEAIVGTCFKKSYYSTDKGHNVSEFVLAQDLDVDYFAKSIDGAKTKTHRISLYRNDIYSRVKSNIYRDILDFGWYLADATSLSDDNVTSKDNRAGQTEPEAGPDTPFTFREQHCWLDLDGDGYQEPYIVTFEDSTQCVVRIVTRFNREEDVVRTEDGQIIRIHAIEYFTKRGFIPSPDGSLMDLGFGVLLGPLNESVDSAINQIFDAGTLANTGGGFLGRGAKIRGGIYNFDPFSWTRVDSTGDDLRKNIFPLPVREPSAVLFNLLNLIIEYTNKISGATDMLTGVSPGQNTPAETSRMTVEQGQKVYSAIFKRVWRSLKLEFKKLYQLNAVHLPAFGVAFGQTGSNISKADYLGDPGTIVPAADPTITSESTNFNRAAMVRSFAESNPGYNKDMVERTLLQILKVPNIDQIYPGQASLPPPPPDPKIQIQQMKMQNAQQELQVKVMQFVATLQETRRMNTAKISEMVAKADKYEADAKTSADNTKVNAFNAAINAVREENTKLSSDIDSLLEIVQNESDTKPSSNANGRGVPSLESQPGNQVTDESS